MENKIKYLRDSKCITQKELAIKVGITRPYLSDLERGKKNPGTEIAMKIAKVLESSVEEIFFNYNVHHGEQIRDSAFNLKAVSSESK